MDKGLRLGFNQIVWSRERDFLARAIDLPTGLDDEVFQALGQLDSRFPDDSMFVQALTENQILPIPAQAHQAQQ